MIQAFALAKGFTQWAAKDRILLYRRNGNDLTVFKIDYKDIVKGQMNKDIFLQADDIIIVPDPFMKVTDFIPGFWIIRFIPLMLAGMGLFAGQVHPRTVFQAMPVLSITEEYQDNFFPHKPASRKSSSLPMPCSLPPGFSRKTPAVSELLPHL